MKYSQFLAVFLLMLLGAACQKTSTTSKLNLNQSTGTTPNVNTANTNVGGNNNLNVSTTVGRYINYSSSIVGETTGTKILFFHAPWCPQCRKLEQSINTGPIPENVTIMKVDYDSNQSLRQQFGVTLQTTMVLIDDAGQLVKKFNAYDDPSLERVVRELL